MRLAVIIQTASANMLRDKARTSLTIIAIIIGALTISLTNGIGNGIKSYLNKQVGNLGANNTLMIQKTNTTTGLNQASGGPQLYNPSQKFITTQGGRGGDKVLVMNQQDINLIKKQPNITAVDPEKTISPDYISAGGNKYQFSVTEQFGTANLDMISGRAVNLSSPSPEITIPSSFVQPLGFSSSQAAIGKTILIGITNATGVQSTISGTIVGVQQKTLIGSTTSYINTVLANQLFNYQSEGLPAQTADQFSVLVATFTNGLNNQQITAIKSNLKNLGYTAETTKDMVNTVFTVINAIIIVFDIFGGIALLAATFGIVNTLFMAVQERTKEIGLMKALGMNPHRIFLLFSLEASLIGLWGSVLGVLLADLIGLFVNNIASHGFLKDFSGLHLLSFPLTTSLIIIIIICVIAFLAGTLPALRASRKDPIDALRYE